MHIPDGYLSPSTCAALYAAALPFWTVALRRVRALLATRFVPLISLFAAFSFVIMMFNLPLPGGTTGHAVGIAMAAIVLGPWGASLAISVALAIQALLFGDGGILTLGANCFNLAIAGSFVAAAVYRLAAAGAPLLAPRRVFAAGLAGYCAINVAAFLTALELGLQPLLFHDASGAALYAPYPLNVAVPAMMLGHLTFAGLAEALLTAGVVRYLQQSERELLGGGAVTAIGMPSLGSALAHWGRLHAPALGVARPAPGAVAARTARRRQCLGGVEPGGSRRAGGAGGDRRSERRKRAACGGAARPRPPGDPVDRATAGLRSGLPAQRGDGLSHLGPGRSRDHRAHGPGSATARRPDAARRAAGRALPLMPRALPKVPAAAVASAGFRLTGRSPVERTLEELLRVAERSLHAEETARRGGLLQALDARAKWVGLGGLVLAAGLARSFAVLAALFGLALLLALLSRLRWRELALRAWLPALLFTGLVAGPALFLTPGPRPRRVRGFARGVRGERHRGARRRLPPAARRDDHLVHAAPRPDHRRGRACSRRCAACACRRRWWSFSA